MSRIFTPAQRAALERACAECAAASELIGTLKTMGFDMSLKEQENEMVSKAAHTALTADDAFAQRADPEIQSGPVPAPHPNGVDPTPAKPAGRKKGGSASRRG